MSQLHPTVQGRSDEDHSVVFCLGPSSLFALDTSSLRNMLNLGTKHPQLAEEFENGKFVVNKSSRAFSRIPIDRTHEQNNKCAKGEREKCLFNDALNTFYLRLYGVRHMVKDHSDSEKVNPLPPHSLLLSINSKGSFICTIPQTG